MIRIKGSSDLNQELGTYEKLFMWFELHILLFESHDLNRENMRFELELQRQNQINVILFDSNQAAYDLNQAIMIWIMDIMTRTMATWKQLSDSL